MAPQAAPKGKWTIYHNPRCSKSRAALAYLRERSIEPTIVEYLKTKPDADEIGAVLESLGIDARELLRTGEDEYDELGLKDPDKSSAELTKAMAEHAVLIQRPIIIRGDRAVIGRPTEAIDSLLDE